VHRPTPRSPLSRATIRSAIASRSSHHERRRRLGPTARGALLAHLALLSAGCVGVVEDHPARAALPAEPSPTSTLRPLASGLRTLTPTQYAESLRFVLSLAADDPVPEVGQWATSIAAARGGLAPSSVAGYEAAARSVTAGALADPARREALLGCTPSAEPGDLCVREVIARIGRRAYRRPLTEDELARWTSLAGSISVALGDPLRGIEHAISGILQSPSFLYRVELGEPDAASPGRLRYSSHELATRLAYLFWSSPPDDALLDAADDGSLLTDEGLEREIARLSADPRAERGVTAFLADFLEVDALRAIEKDGTLFPDFAAMQPVLAPQLLLTARVAVLEGGLRALFSSRTTFVDASLAPLYALDASEHGDALERIELAASSPRRGILTTPGLLAMHAYPGKTSPALRGLFVRRRLLCQSIPPPPPDVSTLLPETDPDALVTTRELVAIHQRDATCASCHSLMDPIGLALEHFDADGSYRATQNGLSIDASGELDGVPFTDAATLATALADHDAFVPCVAAQLFGAASGTTVSATEDDIERLADESDGDLRALVRAVARSEAFRYAWPGSGGSTP
jgi:hypothetical protein